MKHVLIFIALFLNIGIIAYLSFYHLNLVLENAQYKFNYETMRGELESLYRTQARGTDPAFICKFKALQHQLTNKRKNQ